MRMISKFVLAALILAATSASAQAQVVGTFYWRLAPLGSVLNVTITQKGGLFVLEGFETQCGGNLSLPLTGMAIPQANGTIFMGMTSINETGSGLHSRASSTAGATSSTRPTPTPAVTPKRSSATSSRRRRAGATGW